MDFEILGDITVLETIASGRGIRDLRRLQRNYGKGRWRKMKAQPVSGLRNGDVRLAELHWYEAHGIDNRGYPASLELHKIYRVVRDDAAAADGDIRVVDESGEDYLYSADRFVEIEPPQTVRRSLLHAAKAA